MLLRLECVLEQVVLLGGTGPNDPACELLIGRVPFTIIFKKNYTKMAELIQNSYNLSVG